MSMATASLMAKLAFGYLLKEYRLKGAPRTKHKVLGRRSKCINITKKIYTSFMINKVLPAIIQKWPCDWSVHVQSLGIQQDNPNMHMRATDAHWVEASNSWHLQQVFTVVPRLHFRF